jgi:hypothetical protein
MEHPTAVTQKTSSALRCGMLVVALSTIAIIPLASGFRGGANPQRYQADAHSGRNHLAQLLCPRSVLFSGHVHVEIPACRLSSEALRLNYGVIFARLRRREPMAAFESMGELGGLQEEMPSGTPPVAQSY